MSEQNRADNTARFPSLASLRASHGTLLGLQREGGVDPAFLEQVEDLIRKGRETGALLDGEEDRWTSQSLLDYWVTVLVRAGREPPEASLIEFDSELAPELDEADCPYVGLDAFGEAHHSLFFGRQRLVEDMVQQLQEGRLLTVLGPSGSGKSSTVLAGLLPALKSGALPGSKAWLYCPPMVPGSNPLASLAASLAHLPQPGGVGAVEPESPDPERLAGWIGELQGPTVLVVDQFEELFTLCLDDNDRQAFINLLLSLIQTSDVQHRLILTMRIDFEPNLARLPELQPLFEAAAVRITPLSAGELREAIEKPAELVGLRFQAGVVDALLQDILGEPAALPLLQFTLLKLWEKRERNRVTREAYQRLGGGRQALASSADEFYAGLIPEEQVTARRILLRMVRPGEGLEVTSNRIRRETLYQSGEARDRVDRVLDKLVGSRLVRLTEGESPGDAQVEVAHEALVRNWPRLVSWLEDEREAMRQRLRLTAAAEQWEMLGRDPEALWRGALLATALGYEDVNELEAEFLRASQDAAEAAERAKEAARQRELAQARALAEQEADANKRLMRLVERLQAEHNRAEQQARLARSRELATAAIGSLYDDPERSVLLALQAVSQTRVMDGTVVQEAECALHRAIQALRTRVVLRGHTDRLWGLAWSPDGTLVATASSDHTAKVWDAASGLELLTLSGHSAPVIGVAFSPDGTRLATASDDGTAKVWDAASGQALFTLHGHTDEVWAVAYSPDGLRLATGSQDASARVWDAASGQHLLTLAGHRGAVGGVAFSADGALLATASSDEAVKVWDAALGEEMATLHDHSNRVNNLTFSPDGMQLASASDDGRAIVRDLETDEVHTLTGHADQIWGRVYGVWNVAFSPDGVRLATASSSGTVNIWDLHSGEVVSLSGHSDQVFGVAFSPDGAHLATASFDGTAKVWDVHGHSDAVYAVAYSPDGTRLASASRDRTVKVWDVASDREVMTLVGHTDTVLDVTFAPDGAYLATAGLDGPARVWDAISGQELLRLAGHRDAVWGVAFGPDGTRLATASLDRTAKVWDTISGQALQTLEGHDNAVLGVAFGPDGRCLATASADGKARVWDAASGEALLTLEGHTDAIMAVAFGPDGRCLATASLDGLVKVWDAVSGRELLSLSGHDDAVIGLAFDPGGKRLATGSADRTVRVWDTATGKELLSLSGHDNEVSDLAFSPDGAHLAIACGDTMAHIHPLLLDDLLALAWRRVTRSLTAEECQKYLHAQPCPAMAVEQLVEGKVRARAGDVEGSVASFQAALGLDPTLPLHPEQEVARFAVPGLVARGRSLARTGDVRAAVGSFHRALDLDPGLPLDPEQEANRAAAAGLEARGQHLAYGGDIEGAIATFREALALEPTLPLKPEERAREVAAVGLVARGQIMARSGDVDGAIAAFQQAQALDPDLSLEPEAQAGYLAAGGLVTRGRNLAKALDLDGAAACFRRALALDPDLDLEPQTKARQIAAYELAVSGEQKLRLGETAEAIAAYTKALELEPELNLPVEAWHNLCWVGSLRGHAAEVIHACERAVALEPDNYEILDSRGVARALCGDVEGAIEDLDTFVRSTSDEDRKAQRRRWIEELVGGRNPFTQEEIERLLEIELRAGTIARGGP